MPHGEFDKTLGVSKTFWDSAQKAYFNYTRVKINKSELAEYFELDLRLLKFSWSVCASGEARTYASQNKMGFTLMSR
jgi:hypothetical protein